MSNNRITNMITFLVVESDNLLLTLDSFFSYYLET